MSADYAIQVKDVWKRYGLPLRPYLLRKWDRLRGNGGQDREQYGPWVLRDVSFDVKRGESLGIVGRNGAGKSTLLKLIAGVSPATHGSLRVTGRLFPMIELAAGIHRDLTGRENIKLLGAIMGFSPRQMDAKMPEVEAFSELDEWLDKPVWQYSSGMQARLGFSVAVNVDADILLIDEVLAVGDVSFQKKCLNRMDTLANSGVTIVLVTHSPYAIERLCDRAVYLHDGRMAAQGATGDILQTYFRQSFDTSSPLDGNGSPAADDREGTGAFRIAAITLHDAVTGAEVGGFFTGDSIVVRISLRVREPLKRFGFVLRIVDPAGTVITYIKLSRTSRSEISLREDGALECRLENVNLLPGQYWLDASGWEVGGPLIDSVRYAYTFSVQGRPDVLETMESRGLIHLPASWSKVEAPASD